MKMRKLIMVLAMVLLSAVAFAQEEVKADYFAKFICSQKYGLDVYDGSYKMTVIFDDETLKFSSEEGRKMDEYDVAKKTDKYVIGKNEGGNYSFYDIANKDFYYMDYFMSRYSTAGYGAGSSTIKQTVLKMMELLKEGKTQKDVIQYLIEQAEYDF